MEAEKIKKIIKEHITWTLAEDGKTMCCYFTNHSNIIFQADSIEDATQKGLDILHSWIEFTREMMSNGVDFLEVDEKTFLGKQQPVVMPSDYKEPLLMSANDNRVLVNGLPLPVPFRIVAEDNYQKLISALSKEAQKERIPDVGETIRETAIEFAEWINSNGFTWGDSFLWVSNLIEYSGCVYTSPELFDLFKQRNK